MANGYFVPYEMYVELNVLCALMLDRVGGHVNRTDVVTVDEGCGTQGVMKFPE